MGRMEARRSEGRDTLGGGLDVQGISILAVSGAACRSLSTHTPTVGYHLKLAHAT